MKNGYEILVSILTVSFNSEATIGRTIESVLIQNYPYIEYIIIDGDSKDKTVEIAESYRGIFKKRNITYKIISEPDRGMYDALNKGARLCNGKLVGQINADDWYEPNAVTTMVRLYEKEHYDVAWGSIRIKKRSGDIVKHAKIGYLWTTTHWCHPGMFSRLDTLLEFPYALETMYDDFDYITSVHQAGKRIVTVDSIISNFTFGEGGQSTRKGIRELKRRVDVTYSIYRKHGLSRFYLLHRWLIEGAKFLMEYI